MFWGKFEVLDAEELMNVSALLKEAAVEVATEERKTTEDGFRAAVLTDQQVIGSKLSPRLSESPPRNLIEKDLDVTEDVHALLEQMSMKPKYSGNTIDDVDALLMANKKDTSDESSRRPIQQYKRKKDEHQARRKTTKSVSSSRLLDSSTWGSELSRVSLMLAEADEKRWGRDIRSAFKNPQQELLFRSMKVVRPTPAAKQLTMNATTAPRVERFTACDLDLHSTRKRATDYREEKKKLHESMRLSADRMSTILKRQPSRHELKADATLAYATYDDAKECTFQPRIAGKERKQKKRGDDDEEKGEADRFAFINRQEAEERNRRDELQFRMGKADYDARVDKKTCPRCGAKQSYDEFKEKRKNCVHCNVEYCAAVILYRCVPKGHYLYVTNLLCSVQVSWEKVSRHFFQSNLEFSQRVAEKKAQLRRELEAEYKCVQRREIDPQTGRITTFLAERKQRLSPEEELEFFDRMEEALRRREEKVSALDDRIKREKFPFRPSISSRSHKSHKEGDSEEEFEEEEEEDEEGEGGMGGGPRASKAVKAFLRRYMQDLEARKDKYPAKYVAPKPKSDDESMQPFRISRSIERGGEIYL